MLIRSLFSLFRINTAIAGVGGTATSPPVDLRNMKPLAIVFRLTSPGVADVSIEVQASRDGVTWGALSTVVASTNTTYAATPEGENVAALSDPLNLFARFKVTGVGANDAGTVITVMDLLFEENT